MSPNFAAAWNFRGLILEKFERYSEAIDSFDKVSEDRSRIHTGLDKQGNSPGENGKVRRIINLF